MASLEIYQVGNCCGCNQPVRLSDNAIFVVTKEVTNVYCEPQCYLSGHQRIVDQHRADRLTEKNDVLTKLGYDPRKPSPRGENEGPPAKKKRQRKKPSQ